MPTAETMSQEPLLLVHLEKWTGALKLMAFPASFVFRFISTFPQTTQITQEGKLPSSCVLLPIEES